MNIGSNSPHEVLQALIGGGADGAQGMGEAQGAQNNPLGDIAKVAGGVMNLMKVAGPVLGALGI